MTSSMCAATPKPRPQKIHEGHWAKYRVYASKGNHHAALKTMAERVAVSFMAKMSQESAFRLVRICPTFTVGPMLQPIVNSSMERFADICSGTHHGEIPNRSVSLVDVRDTAAHHVAAYEKGVEGRFFSITGSWTWSEIYHRLQLLLPGETKIPTPIPNKEKVGPVRDYNTKRMDLLGVKRRSVDDVLRSSQWECFTRDMIRNYKKHVISIGKYDWADLLPIAGYYDLNDGGGAFFLVDIQYQFEKNRTISYKVTFSWSLYGEDPVKFVLQPRDIVTFDGRKLVWRAKEISVSFTSIGGWYQQGKVSVAGMIGGANILGYSYFNYVPYTVFAGDYLSPKLEVEFAFDLERVSESQIRVKDADGQMKLFTDFEYDPVKRVFTFCEDKFINRLYMNAAAGYGLRMSYVRFKPKARIREGSTTFLYKNQCPNHTPPGPTPGANLLQQFAGYYALNDTGSFVSVVPIMTKGSLQEVVVGVCTDDKNSTEYRSFKFCNNELTFPGRRAPVLKFEKASCTESIEIVRARVTVIIQTKPIYTKVPCYISPAPFKAFGHRTLSGVVRKGIGMVKQLVAVDSGVVGGGSSLEINPDGKIVWKIDDKTVFEGTNYTYNTVEQRILTESYKLNFCYNTIGVTCGITMRNCTGFNTVVFAYKANTF